MLEAKEEIFRFLAWSSTPRAPRVVSWTPPLTTFVALNVDGSVCGQPQQVGLVVVFKTLEVFGFSELHLLSIGMPL